MSDGMPALRRDGRWTSAALHGTYIGGDPAYAGRTALLLPGEGDFVLAQFDEPTLPEAYGWHLFQLADFQADEVNDSEPGTAQLDLPVPCVDVTLSGIFVSWHAYGLNIEMRVREKAVWAIVEDAFGVLPTNCGSDNAAAHVLTALGVMEARQRHAHKTVLRDGPIPLDRGTELL